MEVSGEKSVPVPHYPPKCHMSWPRIEHWPLRKEAGN